jgi:hypothetical protein
VRHFCWQADKTASGQQAALALIELLASLMVDLAGKYGHALQFGVRMRCDDRVGGQFQAQGEGTGLRRIAGMAAVCTVPASAAIPNANAPEYLRIFQLLNVPWPGRRETV